MDALQISKSGKLFEFTELYGICKIMAKIMNKVNSNKYNSGENIKFTDQDMVAEGIFVFWFGA